MHGGMLPTPLETTYVVQGMPFSRTALAHRVATWHIASYFNQGDVVLYGKYKNKKGIVKSLGKDAKGNPTITISPVPNPTGRKKDKQMGVLKVWHADETKRADLMPPLGYPGGRCFVVKRIVDEIENQRLEDRLVSLVEDGVSLSNPEAAKVYELETERGVWKFKRMLLTAHAQYRMDLRGVTVPEIRLAIGNFFRTYNNAKSRKRDSLSLSQVRSWEMDMMRREPIRWTDPKIGLTVVFIADASRKQLEVVTVFWKEGGDPPPEACVF